VAPEVVAKIAVIRQKMIEGIATTEELKEAVTMMREDRKITSVVAPASGGTRRAKAKAEIKSADDMLDELGKV
jgi:hypothetical protein